MPASRTTKFDRTKTLIVETAIDLFIEQGYEETTMRQIAQKADVAIGSAYYYFGSKEHLVQALYERMHDQQVAAFEGVLTTKQSLKDRLLGILLAELQVIEPYHKISLTLFKHAADPSSPLSPFSPESQPIRDKSIAIFQRLVEGSSERFPDDLKAELPYLLWMYQMGVVLFWLHDRSLFHIRSQKLIQHSVEIISMLITFGSLPLMKPLRVKLLNLLADLRLDNPFSEPAVS
jgi:AcrR family transcriptional regulator